ncbi:MAG: hypothetical protein WCF19_02095 [Chlamydiales bacterium]
MSTKKFKKWECARQCSGIGSYSFGGKVPGADRFAKTLLFTEGAVTIGGRLRAYGCEECEISLQIVDEGVAAV